MSNEKNTNLDYVISRKQVYENGKNSNTGVDLDKLADALTKQTDDALANLELLESERNNLDHTISRK